MGNVKDLTGHKYERLTVIEPKGAQGGYMQWLCKCDCGNEVITSSNRLKTGRVMSCGCMHKDSARAAGKSRFIDLTGQHYGDLTVIRQDGKGWLCKCKCGNTTTVRGKDLRTGNTKSCGCLQSEKAKQEGKKHVDKILANMVEDTNLGILKSGLSKRNKSGVKGVHWDERRGKWEARLGFQGKVYKLGFYEFIEDAAKARREAEEQYHKPIVEKYRGE
jgi:hypothetical protein